jgi:hypothetical protein
MTPNRYEGYKVCLRLKRNHLKISFQCLRCPHLRCAQLLAQLVAQLVPQLLCQLGPQLVPQLLALLLAQLVAPRVWGPKGRDECLKIKL